MTSAVFPRCNRAPIVAGTLHVPSAPDARRTPLGKSGRRIRGGAESVGEESRAAVPTTARGGRQVTAGQRAVSASSRPRWGSGRRGAAQQRAAAKPRAMAPRAAADECEPAKRLPHPAAIEAPAGVQGLGLTVGTPHARFSRKRRNGGRHDVHRVPQGDSTTPGGWCPSSCLDRKDSPRPRDQSLPPARGRHPLRLAS